MLKKGDYKLFIIIAFVIIVLFGIQYMNRSNNNVIAQIFVNGDLKQEISLAEVKENYTIEINSSFKLIIEVEEGRIRVLESECENQYCVKSDWIDKSGQVIACVPNAVIIKIIGGEEEVDSTTY